MKEKPGNYRLLFRVLADAQDRHASAIIPYVTPPINNPEKREIFMNLSRKFRMMCQRQGEVLLWTDSVLQLILWKNYTGTKQHMSEQ